MDQRTVTIKSRYGRDHIFIEEEPHKWLCKFALNGYCRLIGEPDHYEAVDPDGGPFMQVGDKAPFCDEVIEEIIYKNLVYIITNGTIPLGSVSKL